MSNNKIHNLDSLNKQITDLQQKKSLLENQMANNWQYLKSDYGAIIRSSIFDKTAEKDRGSFIYWLFNIPSFKNTLGRTAEKLTIKVENLLVKWMDKISA